MLGRPRAQNPDFLALRSQEALEKQPQASKVLSSTPISSRLVRRGQSLGHSARSLRIGDQAKSPVLPLNQIE